MIYTLDLLNIELSGKLQLTEKDKFVSPDVYDKYPKAHLHKNDLIIIMTDITPSLGLIGKTAIINKSNSYVLNQRVGCLRPISDNVSVEFMNYMFNSDVVRLQIVLNTLGTAQFYVNTPVLKNLTVSVPPLPEQKKIAAILSSVDDVIEKTQAQIDKLKDLKTGMMQELLTKGIGPGGVPHTEFKDSPVGRIPAGWDVVQVNDLQSKEKYSCVGGPFGSDLTSKSYVDEVAVPVIRGANLPSDFQKFTDGSFVYVSEEKADSLIRNMAYPGDLVFTQRGTMGQVGLIPINARFERYVISQSQMKLTVDESIVDKEFLYQYFLSDSFLKALDLETIATGIPHINLGILKSFRIPLPVISEQRVIGEILKSMDKRTARYIRKMQTYINLKKALMQDLLTGKVRVKVDG